MIDLPAKKTIKTAKLSGMKAFLALIFVIVVLPVSFASASRSANAEVTEKDVLTITRTIGFLENAPSGAATLDILYDPSARNSAQEAQNLYSLIKKIPSSVVLVPRMVTISDLHTIKNSSFVFITSGMESRYSEIKNIFQNSKALSFALNRPCIEQQSCVVYINTQSGRIEIIVDKATAENRGILFKPVFLMMVTTL